MNAIESHHFVTVILKQQKKIIYTIFSLCTRLNLRNSRHIMIFMSAISIHGVLIFNANIKNDTKQC